jgi:acyl-CoA synthetase (AMP-forming)/AMP-acid ligase II
MNHAEERPDALFVTDGSSSLTWRQYVEQVAAVRHFLANDGAEPGDIVALLASNSARYMAFFMGAVAAGCCVVTLPTMLTAVTLGELLRDCSPRTLFVSGKYERLGRTLAKESKSRGLGAPAVVRIADVGPTRSKSVFTSPVGNPAETLFNIVYSSGTTGVPKGICHSHAARLAMAQGLAGLGFDEQAHLLISTPLYTNLSLPAFLAAIWGGSRVTVMTKFDVADFLSISRHEHVTHFFLVPIQVRRILDFIGFDPADVATSRLLYVAGSLFRKEEKRRLIKSWPGTLLEVYGMTEGAPATNLFLRDHTDKLDTVGKPIPGCEIRVIDDDGTELPAGETGEIVGRSGTMMLGYHRRPDAVRELEWKSPDGRLFFRTGDIGYLEPDGFLSITDRKKDVIISGGLNIYASDIEDVLLSHPASQDAAVVAAPSDQWGETPVAFVVPSSQHETSAKQLLDWANARLGKYQRLSDIIYVPCLPRNSLGKVVKKELRERLVGGVYR